MDFWTTLTTNVTIKNLEIILDDKYFGFLRVGNNGTKHLLYSQKRQTSRACKY